MLGVSKVAMAAMAIEVVPGGRTALQLHAWLLASLCGSIVSNPGS